MESKTTTQDNSRLKQLIIVNKLHGVTRTIENKNCFGALKTPNKGPTKTSQVVENNASG